MEEQLDTCLALEPMRVSLYAGGSDLLRPRADVEAPMEVHAEAVARLRSSGAQVLLFTASDPGRDAPTSWTRPCQALFSEHVREAADRLHVSAAVLELLGVAHGLELPPTERLPVTGTHCVLREDLYRAREHLPRWIGRRLRGSSYGGSVRARRPECTPLLPPDAAPAGAGLRGSGEPVDWADAGHA